jgi:hypothetical protein
MGIASAITGGGGIGEAFKSLSDGFNLGDLGGLAKMATQFMPPPQNMIGGALGGMLGGGGFEGMMDKMLPDGIGKALKGAGIDDSITSGITDSAEKLQNDPSEKNLKSFLEQLGKIPEDKREAAFDALKDLLPPEIQDKINSQGGNIGGGGGASDVSVG